jgi:hypothetical protein
MLDEPNGPLSDKGLSAGAQGGFKEHSTPRRKWFFSILAVARGAEPGPLSA